MTFKEAIEMAQNTMRADPSDCDFYVTEFQGEVLVRHCLTEEIVVGPIEGDIALSKERADRIAVLLSAVSIYNHF